MREYRVKIRMKGKSAPIFAAFFLAFAFSALILGMTTPALRGVADAAFMILAVLSLLIFKRFVFRRYSYAIVRRDFEAAFDFTVTEQVGARGRIVCRIGVDDIRSVERETKKSYRALHKSHREDTWYDYSMDFFGGGAVLLAIGEEEEKAVVRISFDETLTNLLSLDKKDENTTKTEQKS